MNGSMRKNPLHRDGSERSRMCAAISGAIIFGVAATLPGQLFFGDPTWTDARTLTRTIILSVLGVFAVVVWLLCGNRSGVTCCHTTTMNVLSGDAGILQSVVGCPRLVTQRSMEVCAHRSSSSSTHGERFGFFG